MREYLTPLLALSLLTSLCEYFLPQGKMRRFVTPLLGLAVSAAAFLPLASFLGNGQVAESLLPAAESVLAVDTYAESVADAYKERLLAELEQRGSSAEFVLGENYEIERVIFESEPTAAAYEYILMTLEVPRSHVEIR